VHVWWSYEPRVREAGWSVARLRAGRSRDLSRGDRTNPEEHRGDRRDRDKTVTKVATQLWSERRSLLAIWLATGLVTALGSLLIHNRYTSTVDFILVSDELDVSQLSGGLAALAGRLPATLRGGGSSTPDFGKAVATMDRTLQIVLRAHPKWTDSTVLAHLDLDIDDSLKLLDEAIRTLTNRVSVTADINTSVVSLSYWDRNRDWAAAIAEAFINATDSVLRLSRSSKAAALEEFLRVQLRAARDSLSTAEDRLLDFNLRNRAVQQSPSLTLHAARLQREIDAAQNLFATLEQQAASARLREVQTTPTLSVLDPGRPPYRKSWPPRTILTAVAAFLAVTIRATWLLRGDLATLWLHSPSRPVSV